MAMPVLADHFFDDLRPDLAFFSQWKDEGPWGPQLLPIYFWDGTLFVATSADLPASAKPNWCVVRANTERLKQLWTECGIDSGEALSLSPDEPRGLTGSGPAVDLSALTVTGAQALPATPAAAKKSAAPVSKPSAAPAPAAKASAKPSAPPPPPAPEFEEKTPPPLSKKTAAPAQPSPAVSKASPPPPPVPGSKTVPGTKMPPPAPAAKPAAANAPNDLTAIWGQLGSAVGPGMILLIHGNECFPWKWAPQLDGGDVQPISLETPSPFRIAQRTQKSFHGPIAPNDPTTHFFECWNRGTIPENLTISPILHRDQLVGFLLSWGTSAANTKETLVSMETTAKQVGHIFETQPNLLSAA